jgi:hypothetical protein
MVVDATGEFAIFAFRAGNALEEVGGGKYHDWSRDLLCCGRCWKCSGGDGTATRTQSCQEVCTFNGLSHASCMWLSRESQKHACKGQDMFVKKVQIQSV